MTRFDNCLCSDSSPDYSPMTDFALYTAARIKQIERIAIEDLGLPGIVLMRRAGQAAFAALMQRWPDAKAITVFCGGGNNGGDGYVVARLALQAGLHVVLMALVDAGELKGDALTSCQDFMAAGGRVQRFDGTGAIEGVVVDALLGTGLNRQVDAGYATAINHINHSKMPVIAIDLPSGLNADTGAVMGDCVRANMTITFIARKTGLFTGQAADMTGDVVCDDLAVPTTAFSSIEPEAHLLVPRPMAKRRRCAHKGDCGRLVLVGGNLGFSGAIRLAGEAALRGGAGLVNILTHPDHATVLNLGRPELMCRGADESNAGQRMLAAADVLVVGPGLGLDAWAEACFQAALDANQPGVVDADGLNLLATKPCKRDDWILTPHPGEAARLLNCTTGDIAADRYAAVRALQSKYGGVCVLKGAGTLIADDSTIRVATVGNPGMASGGMGDVLAGLCGALLAQGLSAFDAACLAVDTHGRAADRVAATHGEIGLLASDLLVEIPALLNGL